MRFEYGIVALRKNLEKIRMEHHAVDIDPAKLPTASQATSPTQFGVSKFMANPQPAVATLPVAQKTVK